MSGSRDEILGRIRGQKLAAAAPPDLHESWIQFADPEGQYAEVLKFVGGEAQFPLDLPALDRSLAEIDYFRDARTVVNLVPGLSGGTLDLESVSDPHELAGVDVAIVPGEFAVAENGAVWVSGRRVRQRAVCFLTQRLVLVVPRSELVQTMHDAYDRLRFDGAGYGVFISGPSKTADIEQSLVIGAHGSRSLIVALVGPPPR